MRFRPKAGRVRVPALQRYKNAPVAIPPRFVDCIAARLQVGKV
jgi:hypothetical protein